MMMMTTSDTVDALGRLLHLDLRTRTRLICQLLTVRHLLLALAAWLSQQGGDCN